MFLTESLTQASTILKVYTTVIFLSLAMHLVGFLTVAWSIARTPAFTFTMGLWRMCMDIIKNKEIVCVKTETDPPSRWLQVVQVLETIGLATFILGLMVALLQVFVRRNILISYINIAFILCAGVTIEAGCIYFLIKVNFDSFGYSVSLSVAAGLLALICTFVMTYEAIASSNRNKSGNIKSYGYMMTQTNDI